MAEAGEYRLGGMLRFDPNREGYIVDKLDELSKSHRLSQFLMVLIRLAFESPESIGKSDKLIADLDRMGMTPCAQEFFDKGRQDIAKMQQKVDAIYEMCLQMYTMSQFGKTIGLEDKAKNMARAEFICERQINQLCDILGIREKSTFKSAKFDSVENRSADILEYIINSYDGIVQEIKAEAAPVTIMIPEVKAISSGIVEVGKTIETKDNKSDDDEVIDFGVMEAPQTPFGDTADLSALEDFLGGEIG